MFTVGQFASNATTTSRGQSFTPSDQGPNGTGTVGTNPVSLTSIDIGYPSSSTGNRAGLVYVYDSLPSLADLNSGTGPMASSSTYADGSGVFGTGTYSRTFNFNSLALDPSATYYILFGVNQSLRSQSGNPYTSGSEYSSTLAALSYDLQFQANFS